MGRIGRVVKSMFSRRAAAPAAAVVVQIEAAAGEQRTVEMYHSPGISSAPTEGDRVLMIPVGRGAHRIAVAAHNYQVEVAIDSGEITIFSTNAAGSAVAATIALDNAGDIKINAGTSGAARNGDSVASTPADDPTFWTWLAAAAVVLAGLGVVVPPPTSQDGKITSGSSTVEIG